MTRFHVNFLWIGRFLAVCFILAPIGNIYLSLITMNVPHWYIWHNLGWLLRNIPMVNWIWFGVIFISGILLLKPSKLSWSLAVGVLSIAALVSLFDFYQQPVHTSGYSKFTITCVVASLSVVGVLLYLRFRYMDRRAYLSKKTT